ncbi:unnamed protein product [Spodoptera exigua]|nr:unnamed protein product [Spodoptera exigua]
MKKYNVIVVVKPHHSLYTVYLACPRKQVGRRDGSPRRRGSAARRNNGSNNSSGARRNAASMFAPKTAFVVITLQPDAVNQGVTHDALKNERGDKSCSSEPAALPAF